MKSPWLILVGFILVLSVIGCCTMLNNSKNWTEHFSRHPSAMERHPGLGALKLGAIYELKNDMVLATAPPRNRYSLVNFGSSAAPKSTEDYYDRLDQMIKWGKVGIVEAGTLIRGDRVESWEMIMATRIEGIVYEIVTGPHSGKLLVSGSAFIRSRRARGEPYLGYFLVPNPDYLKLVRPAHLDAAGRPLQSNGGSD